MAETTAIAIIKSHGIPALPENDQWKHRMEIRSESSSRLYIIAKNKKNDTWGCSCMGWKRFRHCKHLNAISNVTREIDRIDGTVKTERAEPKALIGTVAKQTTAVTVAKRTPKSEKAMVALRERTRKSFSDESYNHYDTASGFGSAQEWSRMAQDLFSRIKENPNDNRVFSEGKRTSKQRNKWLAALGLEAFPNTLADLKKIARKRMMETHPDRGGNADDFREVFAAYEKLADEVFGVKV